MPTFEQFVRDEFVPLVMPAYTPATRERYERLLWKEGVIGALGSTRINEIGAREFRALDAAVRKRGVNPRQHLIMVRRVLKTAHEFEVIERMPALPSVPRQPSKLPAAPPREVVDQCLRAATGWLRVAVALAYFGTQRNGEARAMRVRDVDFHDDPPDNGGLSARRRSRQGRGYRGDRATGGQQRLGLFANYLK